MKIKARHRLAAGLCGGAFLLICFSLEVVLQAQNPDAFVTEGERFDSIEIGKSTESDVKATYGENYKLLNHNGYSFEMLYKNLGLSFYYCQADPNKEIFVVEIEAPSKAMTSKGIRLGESTFADVFRLYGEGEDDTRTEYEGIYFYDREDASGDDSEEARNQTQSAETKRETTGFTIDGASGAESEAMIGVGEKSVPVSQINNLNKSNNLTVNRSVEAASESAKTSGDGEKELETLKKKVVKRIELIEKDGLRQCGTKFPKN